MVIGRHTFGNGLRLVHHYDATTRMVALNLLYDVGSRDEQPHLTGLAHLMEHLMFTGTEQAEHFDNELQRAGGESNAWTSVDLTNYYEVLPAHNIETALWLESDRIANLALTPESIRLQQSVVVEEFKQRYINQPYGDVLHLICGQAFHAHPYQWPTIGITPSHIENADEQQIKDFFTSHYSVDNLIVCISGHIELAEAVDLVGKWFGHIKPRKIAARNITQEPAQTEPRLMRHTANVPSNFIFKAYHTCARGDNRFQATDLLSDILANGNSSRLYRNVLVKSGKFSEIDASVTATLDPGLLLVRARLVDGIDFEEADSLLNNEMQKIINGDVRDEEVVKYTNKYLSGFLFENVGYAEKALTLCRYELMGDARLMESEIDRYRKLRANDIIDVAREVLKPSNCSTIYYSKQ